MKKVLVAFFAMAAIVVFARHNWEKIKGSGNLKSETRSVGEFKGIYSQGSMDVVITYGSSNSIEVEADDNILPYIETSLNDNSLVVKTKDNSNIQTKNKIVVRVQMTKIQNISLSGSGNIKGDGAFTNEGKTKLSVSGSGNINLGFNVFEKTQTSIAGSGNIILKHGGSKRLEANVAGSGNVDASAITFEEVDADIRGSGNVKVKVDKSLEAHISGSGNVYYSGNASNVNSRASGSGKLVKV